MLKDSTLEKILSDDSPEIYKVTKVNEILNQENKILLEENVSKIPSYSYFIQLLHAVTSVTYQDFINKIVCSQKAVSYKTFKTVKRVFSNKEMIQKHLENFIVTVSKFWQQQVIRMMVIKILNQVNQTTTLQMNF